MKINRRNFVKTMAVGALAFFTDKKRANSFSRYEQENAPYKESRIQKGVPDLKNMVQILRKWSNKKQTFDPVLTQDEFWTLRKYKIKYKKIDKNIRTQQQKDIIYYYNRVYCKYLYGITREKIKRNFKTLQAPPALILKKVRNQNESVIRNNKINFAKINPSWANVLFNFRSRYIVPEYVSFTISLIENNFGKVKVSKAGAVGPLQILIKTLLHMEELYANKYSLFPPYHKLSANDKFWRESQTGVLYMKHIIDLFDLKVDKHNFDRVDFLILLLCYKEGVNKIVESFDEDKYEDDAIIYGNEGLSALNFDFYINNKKLS